MLWEFADKQKDQTQFQETYTFFTKKRRVGTTTYINNLKYSSVPFYKQDACLSGAVA